MFYDKKKVHLKNEREIKTTRVMIVSRCDEELKNNHRVRIMKRISGVLLLRRVSVFAYFGTFVFYLIVYKYNIYIESKFIIYYIYVYIYIYEWIYVRIHIINESKLWWYCFDNEIQFNWFNISITMIKALVCAYLSLTLAHCLFTIECFTSLFTIHFYTQSSMYLFLFFLKKKIWV